MRKLLLFAAFTAAAAAPLAAQTLPDTISAHPGDTLKLGNMVLGVLPDTGRYQLDVTRRTARSTYTIHSLILARPGTTPPVAPPVDTVTPPPTNPPPSGSFVTPEVVDESFETGWGLFDNGGGSPPTGVTRDNGHADAKHGTYAVLRNFEPNPGGDAGSGFTLPFYYKGVGRTYDRMWTRFDFYMNRVPNSAFKLFLFWSGGFSTDFGGFYFGGGHYLTWSYLAEWSGSATYLADLNNLTGGWHTVEVDFWQNGDPSGNPSAAFWLDGNPITTTASGSVPSPGRWVNGRLDAGTRAPSSSSGQQLGAIRPLSTLNGGNTVSGSIWLDRIAMSGEGRIGP